MPGFLRDEGRQHGGDDVEDAFDVDVHHRVPVGGFQRGKRRARHQPGVEEDSVHFAEAVERELHQRFAVFGIDDIGCAVNRRTALVLNVRGDGFEFVFATRAQHQLGACFGERVGGGFADAR